MSIEPDFIKKCKVKYFKCKQGNLHEGEILNFICIDPVCKVKGLICPVCQSTAHAGHSTLHLKIFLNQINKNLYAKEDDHELGGLSEYLRSLENSKRQIMTSLREMVSQLAEKVKEVEERIESSYLTLRKTVLSQSTVSMKLPQLYRLLTEEDYIFNEEDILKQINKYSELLEYKNSNFGFNTDKIITVDSAKNIVDDYSKKISTLCAHLATIAPETNKLLTALPIKFSKYPEAKNVKINTNYSFSNIKKTSTINIENQKIINLSESGISGISFVQNLGEKEQDKIRKVALKVISCPSGSIFFGLGNANKLKAKKYELNLQTMEEGLFGVCSIGMIINDFDTQGFVFGEGDIIDIVWDNANCKLTFTRRNGVQKCEISPALDLAEGEECEFFAVLAVPGDKVEIVE